MLETSGRHWAARRVRLDSMSNHLCIEADWGIASANLESFARDQGWGSESGRFDLAAAYRVPAGTGRISDRRRSRCRMLLEAERGYIARTTLERILRDHHEARPIRQPGSTSKEERFLTLCMHNEPVGTTTASLIAPLSKDRDAIQPAWISFAAPCTGLFLPIYLAGAIPAALERGKRVEIERAARAAVDVDARTQILSEFMERITSSALRRADSLRAELV